MFHLLFFGCRKREFLSFKLHFSLNNISCGYSHKSCCLTQDKMTLMNWQRLWEVAGISKEIKPILFDAALITITLPQWTLQSEQWTTSFVLIWVRKIWHIDGKKKKNLMRGKKRRWKKPQKEPQRRDSSPRTDRHAKDVACTEKNNSHSLKVALTDYLIQFIVDSRPHNTCLNTVFMLLFLYTLQILHLSEWAVEVLGGVFYCLCAMIVPAFCRF